MNHADRFTSESVAGGHPDKIADQIAFRHEDDKPVGIAAVVLSTQHHPDVSLKKLTEGVMEDISKPILPRHWLDKHTRHHINPMGCPICAKTAACGHFGREAPEFSWEAIDRAAALRVAAGSGGAARTTKKKTTVPA